MCVVKQKFPKRAKVQHFRATVKQNPESANYLYATMQQGFWKTKQCLHTRTCIAYMCGIRLRNMCCNCLDMHTGMYVYMHVYYCVFAINIFSIFLFVCIIL